MANGVVEEFINRAQVCGAFGIPAAANANIDTAAMVWGVGLFLSFENAVNINTVYHGAIAGVADGTILAIPFNAIMWAASPFDGAAVVANVAAGGVIVLGELGVDALVARVRHSRQPVTCTSVACFTVARCTRLCNSSPRAAVPTACQPVAVAAGADTRQTAARAAG